MTAQVKGLGRGLSALLGDQAAGPKQKQDNSGNQSEIAIKDISSWSKQPRQYFAEEELQELANSITKNGVVQPIIVRKTASGKYELIAGERRWRASQLAGLERIPAVIMDLDDRRALEIALVENIQRQDLTPLETAESYQRLIEEYKYTQEELGKALGKSRPQITNTIRLLSLPEKVKDLLNKEKISAGHAKTIIGNKHAEEIAERIVKQGLSVRQTEQLVKRFADGIPASKTKKTQDQATAELELEISKKSGLNIKLDGNSEKGKLIIQYNSANELESIAELLKTSA